MEPIMLRIWLQNFAWAGIASYLVMVSIGLSRPALTSLLLGAYGLGELGRISCIAVAAAWASACATWQYARQSEARQRAPRASKYRVP
jgi:hypothetical protein